MYLTGGTAAFSGVQIFGLFLRPNTPPRGSPALGDLSTPARQQVSREDHTGQAANREAATQQSTNKENMIPIEVENKQHLNLLIGLPLCIARRAGDMLVLHFGTIRDVITIRKRDGKERKGTVGDFALHVQCAWRIEDANRIVTAISDLYYSAETGEHFNYLPNGEIENENKENLRDKKIGDLLQGYDPETRSYTNATKLLVVEAVDADKFGGAAISLSGGYRFVIFPASSNGEYWRLFQPATNEKHFVVKGSKSETG